MVRSRPGSQLSRGDGPYLFGPGDPSVAHIQIHMRNWTNPPMQGIRFERMKKMASTGCSSMSLRRFIAMATVGHANNRDTPPAMRMHLVGECTVS